MLNFRLDNLRGDLFGGLTAGVVALPLALAFGEASGAGLDSGPYGAILSDSLASLFGGTDSQIWSNWADDRRFCRGLRHA